MDMIDSHLHVEAIPWFGLREMATCGITKIVSVPVVPWRALIDSNSQINLIHRLLHHEVWRTEQNSIQLYLGLGIIGVSIPKDVESFWPLMEDYLEDSRFVAIGEVGIDPRSSTDLKTQSEILTLQLEMAKAKQLPVILHTPPDVTRDKIGSGDKYDKREFIDRSIELVHKVGLSPKSVVLDHLDTEEWVRLALENGFYAGITIQDWRNTTPEKVAQWADEFGPDNLLLNSDTSTMPSDPISVAKVAFQLRKRNVSESKINRIVYRNPVEFYRLPL